jgi:7-cyano-7-deazaguanine synthase
MDSAVLLGEALREGRTVHPLYVRCGLAWEKAELHWLKRFLAATASPRLKPLTVLNAPVEALYGGHWSLTGRNVPGYRSKDERVYLPGRNLLFLSQAAVFCARRGIPDVLLGTLGGNPFPDATPAFFRAAEKAAALALGARVNVLAPFRRLTKAQVLDRGRGLPLHLAFSCLSPRGMRPCGRCNKCAERDKALQAR